MPFLKRTTTLPARKIRAGMSLVLDRDGTTVGVLDAYPVPGPAGGRWIWLELTGGESGAVEANDQFAVRR
jgi:hypothetical protein